MLLEPIYAAFAAKLASAAGFANSNIRRPLPPASVNSGQFPAVFMEQGNAIVTSDFSGVGAKWVLPVDVLIYDQQGSDPNAIPASALNTLVDAVRTALAPDFTGKQTLGGLALNCVVTGNVEFMEAKQGQISVAIIPFHILVADTN
jgi:hypothetical protein